MSYSWIITASYILLCGHSTPTINYRTNESMTWDGEFVFDENIHLPKTCYDTRCSPCAHCPNGWNVLHQSAPFSCSKCCPHCAELNLLSIRKCGGSSYEEYRVCKLWSCILHPTLESYVKWVLQELAGDKQVPHSNFDCPPDIRAYSNNLTEKTIDFGIISVLVNMALVLVMFLIVRKKKQDLGQLNPNMRETALTRHMPSIPDHFHGIRVSKDDDRISVIAYNLCGEQRVTAFFRSLNIDEARYIPELEHWYKNDRNKSDSYANIMLDVLTHWCCKETPNNTLYKLVEALLKAGFIELSNTLIKENDEERGHMM